MARAPKTNETDHSTKQEGTTTQGAAAAAAPANEGAGGQPAGNAGNTVTGPDPKLAELEGQVRDLTDQLKKANEDLAEANRQIETKAGEPNPLADELDKANGEITRLNAELNDLLEAPPAGTGTGEEAEAEGGIDRERLARGYLLGVVMAMPENYRLNGLAAKLDEIEQYVGQFEGQDRYIAVELIKSIAHARPNDIPSGRYINDVSRAFAVLDGVNEASIDERQQHDEQAAAFNRLAGVVGASPVPAGFVNERRSGREEQLAPVLDGDDGQNAAANRLQRAAG